MSAWAVLIFIGVAVFSYGLGWLGGANSVRDEVNRQLIEARRKFARERKP